MFFMFLAIIGIVDILWLVGKNILGLHATENNIYQLYHPFPFISFLKTS